MVKRTRAAVMALVALLLCSAACGGPPRPAASRVAAPTPESAQAQPDGKDERTVVTLMSWGNLQSAQIAGETVLAMAPDLAEKMRLEVVLGGQSTGETADKCRLSLAAGEQLPDIVQLNYIQMPAFVQAGALRKLDAVWRPYADRVAPGVINMAQYDGSFYTIPGTPRTKLWFYRQDLFEAAGIRPSEVKTLDDFIAAGQKLRTTFPDSAIGYFPPLVEEGALMAVLSGCITQVRDEKGNDTLTSDPDFIAALEAIKKYKEAGVTIELAAFTPAWEQALADSRLVSMLGFNWLAQYVPLFTPEEQAGQWAVAQYPSFIGEQGGSDAGGEVYVFFQNTQNPELATEYMKRMRFDKEISLAVWEAVGLMPLLTEALDDERMRRPDAFWGDSLYEQERVAVDGVKVFPYTPDAQQEWAVILPLAAQYVNGELDLQTALDMMRTGLAK